MALHAIVIAGGRLPRSLQEMSPYNVKALLPVGEHTLLEIAVNALVKSRLVQRIAVVGGPDVKAATPESAEYVKLGETMPDNVFNAYREFGGEEHDYLVVSPDLPFLTAEALVELMGRVGTTSDIGLPLVAKADFLSYFPDAPNKFETIDGKQVTMGSCMYVAGPSLKMNIGLARDMFNARKRPWRIAVFLGLPIIWGYLTGKLRAEVVEKRLSQLAGCRVKALSVTDATLAYDIDDRENLNYALTRLKGA